MPPKASTDAKAPAAGTSINSAGMTADDVEFLIDCLKFPAGGTMVAVDVHAVATARGLQNARSVSNRISKMKKKYHLPIATSSPVRKDTEAIDGTHAKVPAPKAPSKNRVTKARKTAAKKITKEVKEESDNDHKDGGKSADGEAVEDEEEYDIETMGTDLLTAEAMSNHCDED